MGPSPFEPACHACPGIVVEELCSADMQSSLSARLGRWTVPGEANVSSRVLVPVQVQ